MPSDAADDATSSLSRFSARALVPVEELLYLLVALVLVVGAVIVLVSSAHHLVTHADDGVRSTIEEVLDSLLIVFILVELLSAVRATIKERRLVAEPFLLVGIIASIKEIVVIGAFAESHEEVAETMLQIGVLGAVVVGLAVATLLVRRKEREPEEVTNSEE